MNITYVQQAGRAERDPYLNAGYLSRRAYLEGLALEHGVARESVFALASLLGRNEDFDGLVTAVEDEADRNA